MNRTPQPTQVSAPSSLSQWSAIARPGWSDTLQENTRPRVSPTYTVRWSLQSKQHQQSPVSAHKWHTSCTRYWLEQYHYKVTVMQLLAVKQMHI